MTIILLIIVIALSLSNVILWIVIRKLAEAIKANSEATMQVHNNLIDLTIGEQGKNNSVK